MFASYYSYTLNGANHIALQSRTDPRGYTTTYGYDAMDELNGITYSDGTPSATFSYSPIGNLTQSKNGNVVNNYTSFDGDGRVTASNVQMQGVTYNFTYGYDLAGNLTKEVYPSGRTVNTAFDITARPMTVNGMSAAGTTTNYVQSSGYYPDGHVQFWQYASNLWSWQSVDNMLRPWQAWATMNNNGNNWMFYAYNGFDTNSDVISANEGFGPAVAWNNMTFFNDQYQYDGLKRLFKITDTNYARQYSWDAFGNPSLTSGLLLSGLTPQSSNGSNPYNPANNRLVSNGYEARGNMTSLGAVTMGYDAESNLTGVQDTGTGQNITWIFDAEGQRAQKWVTPIGGGSQVTTTFVHDAFGQLAAEYNSAGVTPACTTCYLTYDMLGSVRMVTDQSQSVIARHDYLPFGEEIPNGTAGRTGNGFDAASNVVHGFTGQEADGGTASLDFFNARHLSAPLGGFIQPDPGNAGADIMNPQSWNGYGYVTGNPLGLTDPSGACDIVVGGFTQQQGTGSTREQGKFAAAIGAREAYPFKGSTHSLFPNPFKSDLLDGSLSTTNFNAESTRYLVAQINDAAQYGPVNLYGVSAGAAAITSALPLLSSSVLSKINNIVYLVPAANGQLATDSPNPGGSVALVRGTGNNYIYETDPAWPDYLLDTNCSHNANCVFGQQNWEWLKQFSGSRCPSSPGLNSGSASSTINYGGGGGSTGGTLGGGWYPVSFGGIDLYPIPVVTSTITYQ